MSTVNIKRAVSNIRAITTVYTPIIETVVNAIEAIEAGGKEDGLITITVQRDPQQEADESVSKIKNIRVTDNGIGFTDENRNSFDTLYSDHKINKGGKGFGRFISLKYFDNVHVDSIYVSGTTKRRTFSMGKEKEIIVNEVITPATARQTGTTVVLESEKRGQLNRRLATIARSLVEILLPYFTTSGYLCPRIVLMEADESERIVLNDYLCSTNAVIREVALDESSFTLTSTAGPTLFLIRVFKIFSPKNKISKISLVADKREVTESPIHNYIPEFADEFFEKEATTADDLGRNYIIKTYVFSDYLNEHVSLERGEFEFHKESDVLYGISQAEIERRAAGLTKAAVLNEVATRQERKKARINSYVEDEAPWHKSVYKNIDISSVPMNANNAEIEALLQREKFRIEVQIRREVSAILADDSSNDLSESVSALASKISESSRNDLVHYIALRRKVLELFRKSLKIRPDGTYPSEETVHDIIFPTKKDSLSTGYEDHNLWIVDERLNFTSYISSELPLNGGKTERPDLLIFDRRVAFRGENESSNPVTIFEFKRPGRDDFVNLSSKEDPVQQIIRYVNNMKDGKFKTPEGLKIEIGDNTPFFGYVVCELSAKVEGWLHSEKDFKPMPDRRGWFKWYDNINLYVEVLSWDKLLRDSDMRNKVFFHKLGIQ